MLCKIGQVEVWRILDLLGPFKTPEELFPNAGPDVADQIKALDPDGIFRSTGHLILPIQGFLLKTGDQVILIDSCVGHDKTVPSVPAWHQQSGGRFMGSLAAAGVTTDDVDIVMCTHLHTDHVGWNTQLVDGRWVPTFANAKYILPKADECDHRTDNTVMYQESVLPVVANGQAELIEAPYALNDAITLIPTPGHTEGHVSVQVESNGRRGLITGDAIHSTAQCTYPEWHFKYDSDPVTAVASRKQLLETVASTGSTVLGSHFTLPSIGHVYDTNGTFSWKSRDD
ncbi:MAG: MBL fold metallo-hydrolase [Planktomarina sp.]